MPLVIAPENKELTVLKILVDEKTKKHLESLGITVNSKLKVLRQINGSVVCMIKEGRLALDSSVASKIIVC